MSSIYQIIPKVHKNPKGQIYKKYYGEEYKTYFQYSIKRVDGKRYTKQKYIGLYTHLPKKSSRYTEVLTNWIQTLQSVSITDPRYYLKDILNEFYVWNGKRVRNNELSYHTATQTKSSLEKWLGWVSKEYGAIEINSMSWGLISKYDEYLRYDKPKIIGRHEVDMGVGLAPKTRQSHLSYIRTFLRWSNRSNYLSNEVLLDILNKFVWPSPRPIKEEDELYPPREHQKVYLDFLNTKVKENEYSVHRLGNSKIEPTWFYYVLLIQGLTGTRPGEIMGLSWKKRKGMVQGGSRQWSYLDLDKNEMSIYCKKKFRRIPINQIRWIIDRIPKKIGRGHNPKLMKERYLKSSMPKGYKRVIYKEYKSTYLFENPYTRLPYSPSRLHECHRNIMKELELPLYGPHSWRRSWITRMFDEDMNLTRIADYVGHSSSTMSDLYRKFRPTELEPIVEQMKEWV